MLTRWTTCLFLLLAAGCGPASQNNSPGDPQSVAPAPAAASASVDDSDVKVQILDFEGITQLVAAHKGQVVVMDGWSTSCLPCMREFPNLVKLHKKYGPDKLVCISLSFNYEGIGKPEDAEVIEPVLAFLRRQGATFENVLSSEESDVLYEKFKLASIPAVFVYDQEGNLRKRFDSEDGRHFTYADVEKLVVQLLEEDK